MTQVWAALAFRSAALAIVRKRVAHSIRQIAIGNIGALGALGIVGRWT